MPERRARAAHSAALTAAAITLGLGAALFASPARADQGDPPDVEARRVLHLLGYVEVDYRNAVADGVVVSEAEHSEQLALLDEASMIAARLGPAMSGAPILEDARRARVLVHGRSPEADVKAAIATMRAKLLRAFRLDGAPASAPDRRQGEALFIEHCATCHGAEGRADTQRAASLSPRPTNFHDAVVAETVSPARVASTVRFGIGGTAMIPFTFLSDAERWDLGFYVGSLRHGSALPPGERAILAPAYALAELAARSDGELLDDLFAAGLVESDLPPALAALRARAPFDARSFEGAMPGARAAVDRARLAIAWGDPVAARASLKQAYFAGIGPATAALRPLDPELAGEVEARLLDLRASLSSEPPEGGDALAQALLRELTRADFELRRGAVERGAVSAAVSMAELCLLEGLVIALGMGLWLGARGGRPLADALSSEPGRGSRRRRAELGALGILAIAGPAAAIAWSAIALRAWGSPIIGTLAGVVGGALVLAAIALLGRQAARLARPAVASTLSVVVLGFGALLLVARGIAWLQLAGVLPVHSAGLPSVPAIGVHSTAESWSAVIGIVMALVMTAVIRWRARR